MESSFELDPQFGRSQMAEKNDLEPFKAIDRDRADLLRLGKKPVLKVRLRVNSQHKHSS